MPRFRIRMINSELESVDEVDYASLDAARKNAIAAATSVASDTIAEGAPTAAVEIEIYADDYLALREVVTLTVANLTTGE